MYKRKLWVVVGLMTFALAACGGGGGGGSTSVSSTSTSTTSTSSTQTPSELTVTIASGCQLPANGSVSVAPANAASTACAAGVPTPGSSQILVPILYGSGAGYCPANMALLVSASTSCGVLTNSFIPGQTSTITLAPAANTALQQFIGTWSLSYHCNCGGDSGSCTIPIDSTGKIVNGSCQDANRGTISVSGAVDASGNFNGNGPTTGDVFSGTLSGTNKTGSGTWVLPNASDSGPWTATLP